MAVEVITVWISKYALTPGKHGGVHKAQVENYKGEDDWYYPIVGDPLRGLSYNSREVFLTEAEALADAEERKLKKIASLEKSIAKLKKLSFTS